MSVTATISVFLSREKNTNIPGSVILPELIRAGWRIFTPDGMVGHLPPKISNDFDWQYTAINFESLIGIFKEKETREETTGVCLFWQNTLIGGSFSFFLNDAMRTFSMNINEDRQLLTLDAYYVVTDFQWYLEKLLPTLNEAFGVELFQCQELK